MTPPSTTRVRATWTRRCVARARRRPCLFRQHVGIYFGRRAENPGAWRSHRDLRHRVLSELESLEYRPTTGAPPAGEARPDARLPRDRLHEPLSGGRGPDFSMDQGGTRQLPRRDARGLGACPRLSAASLQRRKYGQVRDPVACGKYPTQRVARGRTADVNSPPTLLFRDERKGNRKPGLRSARYASG